MSPHQLKLGVCPPSDDFVLGIEIQANGIALQRDPVAEIARVVRQSYRVRGALRRGLRFGRPVYRADGGDGFQSVFLPMLHYCGQHWTISRAVPGLPKDLSQC